MAEDTIISENTIPIETKEIENNEKEPSKLDEETIKNLGFTDLKHIEFINEYVRNGHKAGKAYMKIYKCSNEFVAAANASRLFRKANFQALLDVAGCGLNAIYDLIERMDAAGERKEATAALLRLNKLYTESIDVSGKLSHTIQVIRPKENEKDYVSEDQGD